jgi:MFS family permease
VIGVTLGPWSFYAWLEGTIFNVPYIFEVYYIPTQQALGISKSQMGMLMGIFGIFSLAGYGPGGWLADRVP